MTGIPALVVDCRDGAPAIAAEVYLPDVDPQEAMILFRRPGQGARWVGRLRYMRRPMPGEARAAAARESAGQAE